MSIKSFKQKLFNFRSDTRVNIKNIQKIIFLIKSQDDLELLNGIIYFGLHRVATNVKTNSTAYNTMTFR